MKLLISSLFVFSANAFAPINCRTFSRNVAIGETNLLEGREISNAFTPINNMLLVKKAEIVDQTEGGIFLTGKQVIAKSEGIVVSIGQGKVNSETGFHRPMPVEVGESVIFGKFDGESITYNGETHTVIRDDDILVKFAKDSGVTLKSAEATFDNVLIKVEKVEVADTASGILISATVKKASVSSVGEVLKVGPGRHAFNGEVMGMDVVPGDMVKFRDFAAQEINLNGEDYAIVKMSDLLAKF